MNMYFYFFKDVSDNAEKNTVEESLTDTDVMGNMHNQKSKFILFANFK